MEKRVRDAEDAPFLDMADMRRFLSSCEEGDEVGVPGLWTKCLGAEMVQWKYGRHTKPYIYATNTSFCLTIDGKKQGGFIDLEVISKINAFDQIEFTEWYDNDGYRGKYVPVTKAELRRVPSFAEVLGEGTKA